MKNKFKTLLVISPFTQFNTPYPSVSQLAGFLQSQGQSVETYDLSLKVLLTIFSREGLTHLFRDIREMGERNETLARACDLSEDYIKIIDPVIRFLQGKDPNFAYRFVKGDFLPQIEGKGIFSENPHDEFGIMGIQDKAKYYCSQFLNDITRLIQGTVSPHFGLSRYAEKLSANLKGLDPLLLELKKEDDFVRKIICIKTEEIMQSYTPDLVGFSIPFPGNLLGALTSAGYIKRNYPGVKVVFGGGYINTELRSLKDERIFRFADYITFDDGELPLLNIIKNLTDRPEEEMYVRTMLPLNGKIVFKDNSENKNLIYRDLPAPYVNSGEVSEYISFLDLLNPMHRLWSDGYWNKLAAAHGCYWNKCSFCDTSLDYIKRYSPAAAERVVDWMEDMTGRTGRTAFHFTDEAAPPALLREIALEILKRGLTVSWWGNIRFEKAFTSDLCRLLSRSGCIAVSGGLEAADERVLKLINKGVTLQQAANVCMNFQQAGIMVHAYLMYGFPTQTVQEVINSLELVRQFISLDLFQSAYWHLFSLTVHSPIAKDPERYNIRIDDSFDHPFANNDLVYEDLSCIDYTKYSKGLNLALYNYMRGAGLNENVRKWFDFKVPSPMPDKNLISRYLNSNEEAVPNENASVFWDAAPARIMDCSSKDRNFIKVNSAAFVAEWETGRSEAEWICRISGAAAFNAGERYTFRKLKDSFPGGPEKFLEFSSSEIWREIRENILLIV